MKISTELFVKGTHDAFKGALESHLRRGQYMQKFGLTLFPIDFEQVKKDGPIHLLNYGDPTTKVVPVNEYADYLEFGPQDAPEEVARKLGYGVACIWNSAAQNAVLSLGQKNVTDILEGKNLKFNAVVNDGGMEYTLGHGWVSFRFYFASF